MARSLEPSRSRAANKLPLAGQPHSIMPARKPKALPAQAPIAIPSSPANKNATVSNKPAARQGMLLHSQVCRQTECNRTVC